MTSKAKKGIRRLILDVLKLHEPDLVTFALSLEQLESVQGVNCTLIEVDSKTENIKITLEGDNLSFEQIREQIYSLRGSVHSVDQVVAGQRYVENIETPQD